ncbi:MAG: hypothetical protein ABW215_18465 [Kibdelosporangium sp.]
MTDLLDRVLAAHGGLDRWNELTSLSARVRGGGGLWALKHQEGVLDDVVTRVDLHRQFASTSPFGAPRVRSSVTADRVALETEAGVVLEERSEPRRSFDGHDLATPWDRLQLAYFNGYAMWTYLTEPFSFTWPGTRAEELEPWQEDGHTWRRLKVRFPDGLAVHSKDNLYYVEESGLIRRHDYVSEVLGPAAAPAAHYIDGHEEVQGIVVPTRRRIHPIGPDNHAVKETLIVSIDLDEIKFA